MGLSPRVRGNHDKAGIDYEAGGSIPACAGEPTWGWCCDEGGRVYPRVCGGTLHTSGQGGPIGGLSPRVRGNLTHTPGEHGMTRSIPACAGEPGVVWRSSSTGGSIPACAGEPGVVWRSSSTGGVYPRVCGGTYKVVFSPNEPIGLSPRVRGNPQYGDYDDQLEGSIPACAGEP